MIFSRRSQTEADDIQPASPIALDMLRNAGPDVSKKAISTFVSWVTSNIYLYGTSSLDLKASEVDSPTIKFLYDEFLRDHSQAIDTLYLDSNFLGFELLPKPVFEHLASHLTKLTLVDNDLGDDHAVLIADTIRSPECSVEYLDLSNNNIGEVGASSLAKALEKNTSLKWLSLQYNELGDIGCQAIALALRINYFLETLFLNRNYITDSVVDSLETSIWMNPHVRQVSLKENLIPPEILKRLQCTLVDLSRYRIRVQGVYALAYGSHNRVGRNSQVHRLPNDVLALIKDMLVQSVKQKIESRPLRRMDFDSDDEFYYHVEHGRFWYERA